MIHFYSPRIHLHADKGRPPEPVAMIGSVLDGPSTDWPLIARRRMKLPNLATVFSGARPSVDIWKATLFLSPDSMSSDTEHLLRKDADIAEVSVTDIDTKAAFEMLAIVPRQQIECVDRLITYSEMPGSLGDIGHYVQAIDESDASYYPVLRANACGGANYFRVKDWPDCLAMSSELCRSIQRIGGTHRPIVYRECLMDWMPIGQA